MRRPRIHLSAKEQVNVIKNRLSAAKSYIKKRSKTRETTVFGAPERLVRKRPENKISTAPKQSCEQIAIPSLYHNEK